MNKNIFYKSFASAGIKQKLIASFVVILISAFINIAVLALTKSYYVIFDVLFLTGMGLGIYLGKSKVCAILVTVYFGIAKIMQIIGGVQLSSVIFGFVFLGLIALSIPATFALDKEYKMYLASQVQQSSSNDGQTPPPFPGEYAAPAAKDDHDQTNL